VLWLVCGNDDGGKSEYMINDTRQQTYIYRPVTRYRTVHAATYFTAHAALGTLVRRLLCDISDLLTPQTYTQTHTHTHTHAHIHAHTHTTARPETRVQTHVSAREMRGEEGERER